MDNPQKLATQVTQDEEKQNKTHYVLDTTMRKQTSAQFVAVLFVLNSSTSVCMFNFHIRYLQTEIRV